MDAKKQAIVKRIEDAVLEGIAKDKLVLPSLPTVVAKVLMLLRRRDFSFATVAAAIEPDPIVAARVIRLVNSAALATREQATTILQAVSRLGVRGLHGFLIEISARAVFESQDKAINRASRGVWEHSLAVALLTRDVAIAVGIDEPEVAYLAGLLHDIGKPIVAAMLLDAEKRMLGRKTQSWISADTWVALLSRIHRTVGRAVAVKWQLPEATQQAVQEWGPYDRAQPLSVANIVSFSNAVVKQKGIYVGVVSSDETKTLVDTGASMLGIEMGALSTLTEALPEMLKERLSI